MDKLKDNASTGSTKEGNPYVGDLGTGISYDRYAVNFPRFFQESDFPIFVSTSYGASAKNLVKYCGVLSDGNCLDMGSGTGISTLEFLVEKIGSTTGTSVWEFLAGKKSKSVIGIEMSEGMLLVARYKFHQDDGKELLTQVTDEKLLRYWEDFRRQSEPYKDMVTFLQGDFQETEEIAPESIDIAIGNQFMHWTDLSKSFKQLSRIMQDYGEVVWSSACHFYDDEQFPAAEFNFRYNDFLAYVLDDVCSQGGFAAKDYHSLAKPSHNFESVRSISSEHGFDTKQVATYPIKVDFQVFVQNHVPIFVKQLISSDVDPKELETLTKEAIGRQIVNPKALQDTQHKYDIVPIFRSIKK